jgi:hypothetical protein
MANLAALPYSEASAGPPLPLRTAASAARSPRSIHLDPISATRGSPGLVFGGTNKSAPRNRSIPVPGGSDLFSFARSTVPSTATNRPCGPSSSFISKDEPEAMMRSTAVIA